MACNKSNNHRVRDNCPRLLINMEKVGEVCGNVGRLIVECFMWHLTTPLALLAFMSCSEVLVLK